MVELGLVIADEGDGLGADVYIREFILEDDFFLAAEHVRGDESGDIETVACFDGESKDEAEEVSGFIKFVLYRRPRETPAESTTQFHGGLGGFAAAGFDGVDLI